jgi:hypothetical protein
MVLHTLLILGAAAALLPGRSLFDPIRDLPPANAGESYAAPLNPSAQNSCAIRDVTWQVAAGELPEGLRISSGKLTGFAHRAGAWEFALRASTACADVIVPFRMVVRNSGQADLISVQSRSRSR